MGLQRIRRDEISGGTPEREHRCARRLGWTCIDNSERSRICHHRLDNRVSVGRDKFNPKDCQIGPKVILDGLTSGSAPVLVRDDYVACASRLKSNNRKR